MDEFRPELLTALDVVGLSVNVALQYYMDTGESSHGLAGRGVGPPI